MPMLLRSSGRQRALLLVLTLALRAGGMAGLQRAAPLRSGRPRGLRMSYYSDIHASGPAPSWDAGGGDAQGAPRSSDPTDRPPLPPGLRDVVGDDTLELHEWKRGGPQTVLVLAKRDPSLLPDLQRLIAFLVEQQRMRVLVEGVVLDALSSSAALDSVGATEVSEVEFRGEEGGLDSSGIDLVVTMGGDGLVMHASSLFRGTADVPPVLCFNMGSMGFLTPFEFHEHAVVLEAALKGPGVPVTPRMRLDCRIVRRGGVVEHKHCLNEVVIDRGASPYLSQLECYVDASPVTTIQADGVIISTPTGSTAYSLSAGGSMVHPAVNAVLLTPICPHSLSFRPLLLPETAVLRCDVPMDARSSAWVSFDGQSRQALQKGDALVVGASPKAFPTVARSTSTVDWFNSLQRSFSFNTRVRQGSKDGTWDKGQ